MRCVECDGRVRTVEEELPSDWRIDAKVGLFGEAFGDIFGELGVAVMEAVSRESGIIISPSWMAYCVESGHHVSEGKSSSLRRQLVEHKK